MVWLLQRLASPQLHIVVALTPIHSPSYRWLLTFRPHWLPADVQARGDHEAVLAALLQVRAASENTSTCLLLFLLSSHRAMRTPMPCV